MANELDSQKTQQSCQYKNDILIFKTMQAEEGKHLKEPIYVYENQECSWTSYNVFYIWHIKFLGVMVNAGEISPDSATINAFVKMELWQVWALFVDSLRRLTT